MPPGCVLLALVAGLLSWRRWRRLALSLIGAGTFVLYACSTPMMASVLARTVEIHPAVDAAAVSAFAAEAIVILGGGRRTHAPEFDGPTVSGHALERLRYGARLQRATGLPLVVTGGVAVGDQAPEGPLMAKALAQDFQVAVKWVEQHSRNTAENARNVAAILLPKGIKRVVVLSHAMHLPRAVEMFADQGFDVLPAPTAFVAPPKITRLYLPDFIPSARALMLTRLALHEHLGRLWYRLGGTGTKR